LKVPLTPVSFAGISGRRDFLLFKHRQSRLCLLTLLVCLFGFVISCRNNQAPISSANSSREITDDAGRRLSLPQRVDRVISLAPNLTEIVFAIGAGDRLVGNTTYCDYPAEAKSITKVGDTLQPSLEKLIALRPQVVLVSTASQLEVFTQQLKDRQIAVYVTDPHDLEGVFKSIEQIGLIMGNTEQSSLLVKQLRERTLAVENAVRSKPSVRIFYQLSAEPLYTAGRDSFVTDLIRRAGATSVTADVPGAWPKFSAESALAAKPDAIILPTGGSMGAGNSTVTEALKKSPAAIQGKVYKINDDHLVRPGPRAVNGLEEMAKALHADAFTQ
jgi:iron complex transport system substrate-binding protein